MLGRYCQGGCACRDCGDGQPDVRRRKRAEAREMESEISEELAASIRRGLEQAERGETEYLGSFAQYDDEGDED